ncbi:MAG TPA: hypothetical protein VNG71_14335 [Pyrinomonadaceae bacterium]|nr:hypothetical protein [Pyrinomonadaceae bacterium]
MKNKILKTIVVVPALLIVATVINCGGHSTPPPTTGFYINAINTFIGTDGLLHVLGGTSFLSFWEFDEGAAQGTVTQYQAFTNPGGYAHVENGRVPARWHIVPFGACIAFSNPERDVVANAKHNTQCLVVVAFLVSNPDSVDLASPPSSVTISGGGFDTTYGMPVVEYFDQYTGDLVASATAMSVSGDGTSLQVATPDLSGIYSGAYNIVVSNVASDASYSTVGVATFSACCVDPPPPPPPPDPEPCGERMVCEVY